MPAHWLDVAPAHRCAVAPTGNGPSARFAFACGRGRPTSLAHTHTHTCLGAPSLRTSACATHLSCGSSLWLSASGSASVLAGANLLVASVGLRSCCCRLLLFVLLVRSLPSAAVPRAGGGAEPGRPPSRPAGRPPGHECARRLAPGRPSGAPSPLARPSGPIRLNCAGRRHWPADSSAPESGPAPSLRPAHLVVVVVGCALSRATSSTPGHKSALRCVVRLRAANRLSKQISELARANPRPTRTGCWPA